MKILILDDAKERLAKFKSNLETKLNNYDNFYAENANEAIFMLELHNDFDYIFLDHDLGGQQMSWEEENCGMTVVDYIIRTGYSKSPSIIVHSWNIPRGQEMVKRLRDAGYSVIHHPGVWLNIGA